MALAFLKNIKNYPEVNHLNRNKRDNRAVNLEWCTSDMNYKHAKRNGAYENISGENNHSSTLTREQAMIIKFGDKDYKEYAKMFNVSRSATYAIQKGVNWAHLKKQ